MDFSNYPKNHPMYNEQNKNSLWYLKDETKGTSNIVNFIGLGPKQYCYQSKNQLNSEIEEKKVQKGLKSSSIRHHLSYADYKDALFNHKNLAKPSFSIQSLNHELFTLYQRKRIVNPFDSKRYLLNCNVHTISYGSCYIENYGDKCLECEKIYETK